MSRGKSPHSRHHKSARLSNGSGATWTAVQALPVDERQIVVLHLEGLSAMEIEAITGVSAGAVATRLTRVRQKLTTRLRGVTTVDEERQA
jgi:DNA-directed RNA polymerase specialized sigma24 family protein